MPEMSKEGGGSHSYLSTLIMETMTRFSKKDSNTRKDHGADMARDGRNGSEMRWWIIPRALIQYDLNNEFIWLKIKHVRPLIHNHVPAY
jgi:hypothetical protein